MLILKTYLYFDWFCWLFSLIFQWNCLSTVIKQKISTWLMKTWGYWAFVWLTGGGVQWLKSSTQKINKSVISPHPPPPLPHFFGSMLPSLMWIVGDPQRFHQTKRKSDSFHPCPDFAWKCHKTKGRQEVLYQGDIIKECTQFSMLIYSPCEQLTVWKSR